MQVYRDVQIARSVDDSWTACFDEKNIITLKEINSNKELFVNKR